jgi:hypothetical protein
MTVAEALRAARALIADESRHAVGYGALDADGKECAPLSDRARAWCAYGAVSAASGGSLPTYRVAVDALRKACDALDLPTPAFVNDYLTHATLLAAFDRAIAAAEAKP